mgnify:FL=1
MGGQSKARGTREQRISQALDRKKLEANKDIEKEIMWCHYQKFATDNDKYIPYVVEEEIARDEKDIKNKIDSIYKKLEVGDYSRNSFEHYDNYPIKNITFIRESKIIIKVIFETIYGVFNMIFSPNGTAGWHLVKKQNEEAEYKLYYRLTILNYISKMINMETNKINV